MRALFLVKQETEPAKWKKPGVAESLDLLFGEGISILFSYEQDLFL